MKKLISFFSIIAMTVPTTLLIVSCGQKQNLNVEVWIESTPNSESLIAYQEAAKDFNETSKIKIEVINVAKGNLERELLASKYAPNIINGTLDMAFRVQQIREEQIMPININEPAFNDSFLEYGQGQDGTQLMLPIGKSFSVFLINKSLIPESLTIDKTKKGMELFEQIWEKKTEIIKNLGDKKFLGIDDMADLINLQYAKDQKIVTTRENEEYFFNYVNDKLIINKNADEPLSKLMTELSKIKSSMVFNTKNERPSANFANGELLMTTASSAGLKYYKKDDQIWDKKNIEIMNLPSKNGNFMVQRGDGLIALQSGSKQKQSVANDFINYLISSEEIWKPSNSTGYIPWTKKELGEGGKFKFAEDSPEQEVLDIVKNKETKQFSIEANESSSLYNEFIFKEMIIEILTKEDHWDKNLLYGSSAKIYYNNASKSNNWEIRGESSS